jgi:hypothetical protein
VDALMARGPRNNGRRFKTDVLSDDSESRLPVHVDENDMPKEDRDLLVEAYERFQRSVRNALLQIRPQ